MRLWFRCRDSARRQKGTGINGTSGNLSSVSVTGGPNISLPRAVLTCKCLGPGLVDTVVGVDQCMQAGVGA